jgi:hypothetical protein
MQGRVEKLEIQPQNFHRKTMKRFIMLVLIASTYTLSAQTIIFDHRVEDRDFLQYYYIWNQFDSSTVMYEFGEVTFLHTAERQNIPLSRFIKKRQQLQGESTQGISTDLEGLARTEDFTIQGEGEIHWFGRLQSFRTPCYGVGEGHEPNKPTPNWGVVDRTEFVVQLVDAGSNTVLATLDSVGVNPTATAPPFVDTRYGNNIEKVTRSYKIPAIYSGKVVYVRISPRRYGPTPYGLAISKYSSWLNLTAEYDSTGTSQIPLSATDSLRDMWFTQLLDYCDSVKAQTGWLPDLQGISFAKRTHLAAYHNRYFIPQLDNATGDTVWHEKHVLPNAKRGTRFGQSYAVQNAAIISIAPNPVVSSTVELILQIELAMPYNLILVSSDGQRIGSLWNNILQKGQTKLTVSIPKEIANGSYMLVLETDSDEKVANRPLVLAR